MKITTRWLRDQIELTGHNPIGPSGAARWMICPASVKASAGIPDTGNIYAAEGTKAHELAEKALTTDTSPEYIQGYDDEMIDHIVNYVDYVKKIGGKLFVEQKLDLTNIIPEGYGTADVIALTDNALHIVDLKYGMGKVEADSPQLKIYAFGAATALEKKGIYKDRVILHIFQPRNGGASQYEMTWEELFEFGSQVAVASQRCLEPNPQFHPSEKGCQWCRAAATCKALHNHNLEVIGGDFDILPAVNDMTDDQMRLVMQNKPLIEKWMKAIESEIFSRFEHGRDFPGYKIVEGRSMRAYNKDAEPKIREILGDDGFEQKLKGITVLEKILGKKQFAELGITDKPAGKKTLVPESDDRPAIGNTVEDFDTI